MGRTCISAVFWTGILLWMSGGCTTDFHKSTLLSDAIYIVDNNPQEALELLENFSPEDCSQEQYMQYVVILTQARYMNDQDITVDSLILDAQRYFVRTRNYEMAARASYYAAAYWNEMEDADQTMKYWLATFSSSEKVGDKLFKSKSAYALGSSYYNQEQWEDALPYCLNALELYNQRQNVENFQFNIMGMLGHIYLKLHEPEQAYLYFNDGLELAKKLNNAKYESRFLRNIGLFHHDKGDCQQAKDYFGLALSKQPELEDMLRIHLSYSILYRDMNQPDSMIYYLNMIKERIPEITYPYTRRGSYSELAAYYKSEGKSSETAHYLLLAQNEDLQIKKNKSEKKINAINQRLERLKQKKQTESRMYRLMYDYGIIAFCLLISLLIIIEANKHRLRDQHKQIKEKYDDIRNFQFHQKFNQQHFLLAGLRSIAKTTDELYQKELAYSGSPVWEEQLVLLKEFSKQLAGYAQIKLEKLDNSGVALSMLTTEDLSIMQLSRFRFPDEYIGWILGYKDDMEKPIVLRKKRIHHILAESGLGKKGIKTFFPIE